MHALQLTTYGAATSENIALVDVPATDPGDGQVAVAMDVAPINPSDLLLIAGRYGYRPQLPAILGAEGVGRIVAVGAGVDAGRIGEQVLVLPTLTDTTWREQTVIDATTAIAVDGDPAQLAMLGINPMTAWGMLHGFTDLRPGAWVAQTGASSATAGYVRALARRAGFRLVDIVRRPESAADLRDSGSDVMLVDGPDIAAEVKAALGRDTIDLLIDGVGGPTTTALASRMSVGGTIISYTSRGGQPVSIDIPDLIFRGLVVRGFWLKNWQDSLAPDTLAQHYRELAALVADGALHATIDATYPLVDFDAALTHTARRDRTGKVLFAIGDHRW